MALSDLDLPLHALPAPVPVRHARVDARQWRDAAARICAEGGRLLTLWGCERGPAADLRTTVSAAYAVLEGLLVLELALPSGGEYPALDPWFACAPRLQRAVADLSGLQAQGAADRRPWLDHGLWGAGLRPLTDPQACAPAPAELIPAPYAFVQVEGEGVHEIAVGPVHAGIIEPGHFRFSVVGEKVLRLEQRLGYVHKGVERRFTELPALEAHRLAGRISGDSTVAYAWAYCMALESACGSAIPPRAAWLRALLLERERVANHLGDLGALGNDAALGFGMAQFSLLREDWQRLSARVFGHRLLMDSVLPGGVAVDPDAAALAALREQCKRVAERVAELRLIYDQHAGLQDRFLTTGRIAPALAARLGVTGLAARASGHAIDLRCDQPMVPYSALGVRMANHLNGDVAARVSLRFDEIAESLRLLQRIAAELPDGPVRAGLDPSAPAARGFGWVEGFRGEVLVALELDGRGGLLRCHCHDPSSQNWPALEHAIMGNIVPDFPLINKSFNLSYSGHDL